MHRIMETNADIVHTIREIYRSAPADKLRNYIEKHFVPTAEEKKQNAEVPTPVKLVDEMLDKIPADFWTRPQKVFEPCCGKGNFGAVPRDCNGVLVFCGLDRIECIHHDRNIKVSYSKKK